jgi:hypothetical protein
VAPITCGSSVWNLFLITLLAPRILRWFLDLSKICVHLLEIDLFRSVDYGYISELKLCITILLSEMQIAVLVW